MKIVSIVGMAGAGKSEAAKVFEERGFVRVRFGDVTDDEIRKRGLPMNEESERTVRELLRQQYGMAAYAMLNLSRIDLARTQSDVVIDGLYSWEEYIFLKTYYGDSLCLVAIFASPKTRYERLANRMDRRLLREEAVSRDRAEIEKLNKGGPIAVADFTIVNESSIRDLRREVREVMAKV